jgi:hypothetical protein
MRRLFICEGPDDLAALRELFILIYEATVIKTGKPLPAAGEARSQMLRVKDQEIELIASPGAKSGLGDMAALLLEGAPRGDWTTDPAAIKWVCVVYDPDEQDENAYCAELSAAIERRARSWNVRQVSTGEWTAERGPFERVLIRAIPWRGPGPVADSLADKQSLDRLLCAVAARAFPDDALMVNKWLMELNTLGKNPGWKAALHLWCALVEEKASELNAPVRFLHQNPTCKPHVRGIVEEVSLLNDLTSLLGAPP